MTSKPTVRERALKHLAAIVAATTATASAALGQEPPPVVCDPLPPPRTDAGMPPSAAPVPSQAPPPGLFDPPPVVCDPMPAPFCPAVLENNVWASARWAGETIEIDLAWGGRGVTPHEQAKVTGAEIVQQHPTEQGQVVQIRPRLGAKVKKPIAVSIMVECEGRKETVGWEIVVGEPGTPVQVIQKHRDKQGE